MSPADISTSMALERLATLCRHHVQPCIARPSLNPGGALDERVTAGLTWLVEAIKADLAVLSARRTREMTEFAAKDAERRAKAKADYEAFKAREAAAAGGNPSVAVDASKTASAEAPAKPTAAPPAPAAVPTCTVCKSRPAVRKSAAAKWQPVCQTCNDELEGKGKPAVSDAPASPPVSGAAAVPTAVASPSTDAAPLTCDVCHRSPATTRVAVAPGITPRAVLARMRRWRRRSGPWRPRTGRPS